MQEIFILKLIKIYLKYLKVFKKLNTFWDNLLQIGV